MFRFGNSWRLALSDHGQDSDRELQTVAMNESLKLLDYLVNHADELVTELEHREGADLEKLMVTLLKLAGNCQPPEVVQAENQRKLVRILRGL